MSAPIPADEAAQPAGVDRRIDVMLAEHVRERPAAVDACERLMRSLPGLLHLARYRTGVCDFALDAPAPVAGPHELDADERQLVDRDVVHAMTTLGGVLRPARSGDLIRVVLHTARGALFALQLSREQHLVGVVRAEEPADEPPPRQPAVRAADIGLFRLANEEHAAVGQQPTNYGGWLTPASTASGHPGPSGPPAADLGPRTWVRDESYAGLAARCAGQVHAEGLHYVAVCRPGRLEATADVLDDRRLDGFFADVSPGRRRAFYAQLAQRVDELLRAVVRSAYPAIGSRVRRLVLDVEQGAFFCYPVGLDRYLLAVTLDQDRVAEGDERAAVFGAELAG
ncbi:hypothetical protein [Micromonospora schwarzwaldensis]|uniref:hypothetical protein n=1 Tax=Micromonospora sp. DSM 45708 TaxID=3111767 RepID=UPI0031DC25B8